LMMGPGSASGSRFFRANLSPDGGGGGNAEPTVKELLAGIELKLSATLDGKAKEIYLKEIKSLEDKITALEGKDNSEALKELETKAKELESQIEKLDVK